MFISVISSGYNRGQSLTAISLATQSALLLKSPSLLIDAHAGEYAHCRNYLTDAVILKSIDDFLNCFQMGHLEEDMLMCVSRIDDKHLHFMENSKLHKMTDKDFQNLYKVCSTFYKSTIVDVNMSDEIFSSYALDYSDAIILVVDQNRKSILDMPYDLGKYSEKLHLVVNKFNADVRYKQDHIKTDLKAKGIEVKTQSLISYDANVLNDCNDRSVMNIMLNGKNKEWDYVKDVVNTCKTIFDIAGIAYESLESEKSRRSIFRFKALTSAMR